MPKYRVVLTPNCHFCAFFDHKTDECGYFGTMVDPDYGCGHGRRLIVENGDDEMDLTNSSNRCSECTNSRQIADKCVCGLTVKKMLECISGESDHFESKDESEEA